MSRTTAHLLAQREKAMSNDIDQIVIDAIKHRYDGDLPVDAQSSLDDLEIDSLDIFDSLGEIETALGLTKQIDITGSDVQDIKTVGDLIKIAKATVGME